MDIIVNDTNIFIDLYSVGLLDALCSLPCEIHTVDFVIAEITQPTQATAVFSLVEGRKIHVHSFTSAEVIDIVNEHAAVSGNLSIPDVAVCRYARSGAFTLLTGDRQLRKYAESKCVDVHGLLYVFDKMVENAIITPQSAADKLKELLTLNVRLPKSEIVARIGKWK